VTHSLSFDIEHNYSAAKAITVFVTLRHGLDKVSFDADVDTGSTFASSIGDMPKRLASMWSPEIQLASEP
jgi:hypothetical protein